MNWLVIFYSVMIQKVWNFHIPIYTSISVEEAKHFSATNIFLNQLLLLLKLSKINQWGTNGREKIKATNRE